MLNRKGKFYLRMGVLDSPGVLADITAYFKSKKISISSMFQLEKKIEGFIQLIFVTHNVEEKQLRIAILKTCKKASETMGDGEKVDARSCMQNIVGGEIRLNMPSYK